MEKHHETHKTERSLFVRNLETHEEVMRVVRGNSKFLIIRKGADSIHFAFVVRDGAVRDNDYFGNEHRERIADWLEHKAFADRHTEISIIRNNRKKIARIDITIVNWSERRPEVSISSALGNALPDLSGVHIRH
jgi:hypothetical protein